MGFITEGLGIRKGIYEKFMVPVGVTLERLPLGIAKKFMDPALTKEQRIQAIKESDWGKSWSRGIVEKLVGLRPSEPGYAEAIERVATKGAEGMLE